MKMLKQMLTWWTGQTINTMFYTWRKGELVGTDELGNKYFRARSAVPDSIPERRWVVYTGYSEASQVPPGWHGWMHHRVEHPPQDERYTAFEWQKPHLENATGTRAAYRPSGSIAGGAVIKPAPDYVAWKPE